LTVPTDGGISERAKSCNLGGRLATEEWRAGAPALGGGTVDIRPMRAGEMGFAIGLAAKEGWDPGLADARCYRHTDPEGFLVGEVDGEPVGCISAVTYGADFGFVGLFIVREELRGRGYGSAIWDAGMRRLEGRTAGLDAVLEEQERYARFGFRAAYSNVRYAWEAEMGDLSASGAGCAGAASVPLDVRWLRMSCTLTIAGVSPPTVPGSWTAG
jgi:GNAT superfamily N-acetyltransferase